MRCELQFCGRSYDGQITKICHICMTPVNVCPRCSGRFEKVVCPECTKDSVADESTDDLKALVEKT